MPRIIDTETVIPVIRDLIIDACIDLNDNTVQAIRSCLAREESPLGRQVLEELLANAAYAKQEHIAYPDLKTGSIKRLYVEDMKVMVAIDPAGRVLHDEERKKYRMADR